MWQNERLLSLHLQILVENKMNYNNNFDSVNFILNNYLFSNKQFELSHSNQNQFDRNNVGY